MRVAAIVAPWCMIVFATGVAHAQDVRIGDAPPTDMQIGEPVVISSGMPPATDATPTIEITATPPPSLAGPSAHGSAVRFGPSPYRPPVFDPWESRDRTPPRQNDRERERHTWHSVSQAGLISFAVTYGLTLTIGVAIGITGYGTASTLGWVACVPVIGPFVDGAVAAGGSPGGAALLLADGILQAAGVTLLIAGLMGESRASSAQRRPSVSLVPIAPGASAGLTLSVTTF